MSTHCIKIEGLKGVGTVELELQDNQQVYTFIGVNGIGKTKILESLFQANFFSYEEYKRNAPSFGGNYLFKIEDDSFSFQDIKFKFDEMVYSSIQDKENISSNDRTLAINKKPITFLASQGRGFIEHKEKPTKQIGTQQQRFKSYIEKTIQGMRKNFTSLNMDTNIQEWFVIIAQSINPYQTQKDNREIEIKTVLKLLHEIDDRIDPDYMQISGDGRVQLKIENEPRELSHLSTGFASILKILQSIVSGYGYFTNETQLQNVKGLVLIDEIESHLHLSWQAKIIPLLKRLFPNTTFYITTHSSIVLSQLKEGEVYRLQRDEQGIVRSYPIIAPSNASLIDVLKDAFDIDLNALKLETINPNEQKQAKQQLLKLIQGGNDA